MKQNMTKWVDDILAADQKKGFLVLSFPAIQKMGITVKELIASSDLQAEAMKIVADSTPEAAAAVSMMDLSLEAEAFGSTVHFSDDEVPTVTGSIVNSEEDADALKVPELGAGRTQIYIDAIEKSVKLINDRPVFAGVIGPFSLAGRLMDVSEAMIYCYDEPDMVHTVLEKVSEFLINYINAYKAVGANGVLMAEPLAGLLSPALEEEFSCEYVKKIIAATQTDDFLVGYHNCGNCTIQQIDSIVQNGCRVLHFGNAIDMSEMMKHIPENIIAMGNVDPAGQFRNGTPESVKANTIELLEKCGSYKNFVVSSGCDIPPLSSWDNIQAFFDGINEFYGK
ncbi:Uroporphyrinogen decarboxylase [uncultured Roseburia sp.]|uniref:Uroporphyrinogen decarboxylase family protein n=1 Tax=Brotonthovivens ammoniilytica TaxID=2981725 RepID=A0ABT2TNC6_9FIRM|nr:uroporphyrinogen decarboxylase family protein [Brotonthovivens ammoniilytica]MCU6763733.1 uroporphyrinogen decarboxylase family protein [Brotonthovivens ammoniilytica]SCJ33182.1 Uroporphyrinogen decarboxylase [uncultured Roseburia sp.]